MPEWGDPCVRCAEIDRSFYIIVGVTDTAAAERPAPPARRRLLDAAARLFYTEGINATGVDAVIAAADVARMTFYKQFGSKAGLVAAYLEERDRRWRNLVEWTIAGAGVEPRARLLAVFDALAEWIATESIRGCSFVNAAAELADPGHPARTVIDVSMQALRRRMLDLAGEAECRDPERVVDQLLVLYEGALATTALGVVDDPAGAARATAAGVIGTA